MGSHAWIQRSESAGYERPAAVVMPARQRMADGRRSPTSAMERCRPWVEVRAYAIVFILNMLVGFSLCDHQKLIFEFETRT